MAKVTLRLVFNKTTGKKDIYIDYTSEDDALPIEHENEHRQFIEQLLGQGVLMPNEVGEVNVTRLPSEPHSVEVPAAPEQQPEQQKNKT